MTLFAFISINRKELHAAKILKNASRLQNLALGKRWKSFESREVI
jgi:hypothetical protein